MADFESGKPCQEIFPSGTSIAHYIGRVSNHLYPDPLDPDPVVAKARVKVLLDSLDTAKMPVLMVGMICQRVIEIMMSSSVRLPFVVIMFELVEVVQRVIDGEKYPLQRLR